MKHSILLFLVCFLTKLGVAQTKPIVTLDQIKRDTLQQPNFLDGNMPNSLKNNDLHLKLKLKGNNKLGFDMYESELDKMIVLIPIQPTEPALACHLQV